MQETSLDLREVFLITKYNMVNLSFEETYRLAYLGVKDEGMKRRHTTKTLHKWWCLNCGKEIYPIYNSVTLKNVFCKDPDCKEHAKNPTIVAYQYLKKLKEEQLKLFDNLK